MQYNLIEIYPIHTFKRGKIDPNGKQKWGISGLIDKTDRVKTKSVPNAGGFYHYPVSMPEEIAFNELKQVMINAHKERIEEIQRSLTELEALKFHSKKMNTTPTPRTDNIFSCPQYGKIEYALFAMELERELASMTTELLALKTEHSETEWRLSAENQKLTADLARVTAERDDATKDSDYWLGS